MGTGLPATWGYNVHHYLMDAAIVKYVPANESDKSYFRELNRACYRDLVTRQFGSWEDDQQTAYFHAKWEEHRFHKIVVAGQVIGGVWVDRHPEFHRLREIQIHPDYQNEGHGTRVVRDVIAAAYREAKPVRLWVLHQNEAVKLYRRLGFVQIDETDVQYIMELTASGHEDEIMGPVVKAFIQNEAGSTTKHRHDEETFELLGAIELDEPYPYPYGFIPGTKAADGDCLDCVVLTEKALRTGTVIECCPIGLLEIWENDEPDHKVIAVTTDNDLVSVDEAIALLRTRYESTSNQFPGLEFRVGTLRVPRVAVAMIEDTGRSGPRGRDPVGGSP